MTPSIPSPRPFFKLSFFLLFLLLFYSPSCSLIDDEHCQYNKDVVQEWYNGYLFHPIFYDYDPEDGYQYEGYLDCIFFGSKENGLLHLEDICADKPFYVSAELQLKPGQATYLRKAMVVFANQLDGYKIVRGVTMAYGDGGPATNKLVVDNYEVPILPNFSSSNFASNIRLSIYLYTHRPECNDEDLHSLAEDWLEFVIDHAKITVSYTQY